MKLNDQISAVVPQVCQLRVCQAVCRQAYNCNVPLTGAISTDQNPSKSCFHQFGVERDQ